MKTALLISGILLSVFSFAAADTIEVFSQSMQKNIKCVVITPGDYEPTGEKLPVVYLLHGYGGNYSNWIKKVPSIDSLANVYQMIIVCPDAAFGSWYFDSPVDSSFRYETFTAVELPAFIDSNYNTISAKYGRAITGLSMGGHGAMFLALRHPSTFGACGSMSGALDVSKITKGYDVSKRLGDTITNRRYYIDWSVVTLLENYNTRDSIAFIIDCGNRDFIFSMTKAAHEKMKARKIPHDYKERPGLHDWMYWSNAIKYQLLFFREWFNRNIR